MHDETFIDANGKRVDRFEAAVRVVCGLLLGLAISFGIMIHVSPLATVWVWGTYLVVPLVVATFALRYGDKFWHDAITSIRGVF